ncbi:hypothetical protein [Bradyrhizobium brasilense]|uniref:Uncharacterized protein n=1 Tax=Bradyrhizobium brasilense TaxID=1419277 RepID=A0ABY8JBY3_9BRAD|nr:hypothetical protein [Bradyrhizobium brasilense]WFU62699.1 hypothetical protein QA636_35510 [Bradyrhizobium brasilense]
MQNSISITPLIEAAFLSAWQKYPVEHQAWTDLSWRLAGRVSVVPMSTSLQRAGNLDLVLRAMEDEFASSTSEPTMYAFHFQKMFSEAWLMSVYETIRALRQREDEVARAARSKDSDYTRYDISSTPSFVSIFRDLELLRMPIAKYEIAKDHQIKDPILFDMIAPSGDATGSYAYHPGDPARTHIVPSGLSARKSVTWLALDHAGPSEHSVERRDLADRLLRLKDEIEPAGIREARLAKEGDVSERRTLTTLDVSGTLPLRIEIKPLGSFHA